MGMPCEINSILKLNPTQGYPGELVERSQYHAVKQGYRIFPVDVPIPLVNERWQAFADVIIRKLTWEEGKTDLTFEVARLYNLPLQIKA